MKIEFIKGYRGWITDEVHYQAGDELDVDATAAYYLMECEAAVVIEPEEIDATSGATRLALENDVDLVKVVGSGADGRILVGDVKAFLDG